MDSGFTRWLLVTVFLGVPGGLTACGNGAEQAPSDSLAPDATSSMAGPEGSSSGIGDPPSPNLTPSGSSSSPQTGQPDPRPDTSEPAPDLGPDPDDESPVVPIEPEPSASTPTPDVGPEPSAPGPDASTPPSPSSSAEDMPDAAAPPSSSVCSGPRLEPGGEEFTCGDAHLFENHGRPDNRVNYVIVADGYLESELDTALVAHVENMLYNEETGMYSEIAEPYRRYRNFINVCAVRSPSNESGVDGPGGNPDRDTLFDGGNCGDRLGCVDSRLVRDYLAEHLPEHVDVDWLAATMNENEWWNSGGGIMVWSGKYMESSATRAASVALHEGGHTYHRLADEYGDENLNCNCAQANEPNVACENEPGMSAEAKWGEWFGFVMEGGSNLWNLGEHGAVPGGRYCGPSSGVTRPTQDSEMNLLPYAYNMPSIQTMVHDIYAIVQPIDAHTPNDEPVTATELQVRVVDPEVIRVEWSVDGEVVTDDGGECFGVADLPAGEHTVTARAYDDTPWVRDTREDLEQIVEWTVSSP